MAGMYKKPASKAEAMKMKAQAKATVKKKVAKRMPKKGK